MINRKHILILLLLITMCVIWIVCVSGPLSFKRLSKEPKMAKIQATVRNKKWIVVKSSSPPSENITQLANINGGNVVVVGDKKTPSNWKNKKWIVVKSSSPPSENIKQLANINGWNVVVVGDKKTPSNWKLDGVTFLYTSKQPFSVLKHIPPSSYSRKAIGYLYAISHGANVIYETVDEYMLSDQLASFNLETKTTGLIFNGENLFNPYRHFGQPSLKPSGFPRDKLVEVGSSKYNLSVSKTPSIQIGLVNGDPDIDIIYRLTLKPDQLNITFCKQAPRVKIPRGVFSPYHSKNTLFLYDAFWTMVLPLTASTSEVLRSYWSQRLLWEIDGTVGFVPPNSFHTPTSQKNSNYENLYFKSSSLLKFLNKWKCPIKLKFFECVELLSKDMTDHKFWKETDYQLISAWLADLRYIGYEEPKRTPYDHSDTDINLAPISYHVPQSDNSQNLNPTVISKWKQMSSIVKFCRNNTYRITSASLKPVVIDNILLIIAFNFPYYDNIPYLNMIYSVQFKYILYCGEDINKFHNASKYFSENVTFIEQEVYRGYYHYRCITAAMRMNYGVDGYLMIGDDVLLNSWNILKLSLPFDKIWFVDMGKLYRNQTVQWHWWQTIWGRSVFNKAWKKILNISHEHPLLGQVVDKFVETLRNNTGSDQGLFHHVADIVYIPRSFQTETILFMDIFSSFNVFMEVVIPSVIAGLVPKQNYTKLKGQYLWYGGERNRVPQLFKKDDIFLHPVKLSGIKTSLKKFFCNTYFPLI